MATTTPYWQLEKEYYTIADNADVMLRVTSTVHGLTLGRVIHLGSIAEFLDVVRAGAHGAVIAGSAHLAELRGGLHDLLR